MAEGKVAEAEEWLFFTAKLVGLLAAAYAIYWIVEKVAGAGGLGDLFKGAGDVASAAGKTASSASEVVSAATGTAGNIISGMFGSVHYDLDTTKIPGYAPGNWNKMMNSGVNNPFSNSYVPNAYSHVNPGPTAVQKMAQDLRDALTQPFIPFLGDHVTPMLNAFMAIPNQDNANLVYLAFPNTTGGLLKRPPDSDLANFGFMTNLDDELRDVIASIILSKPIN